MKQATEKKGELRTARYDPELMVEAYQFQGVMQAFPNHFHEHYVVGFIERGRRNLKVKGECIVTMPGDLLLFNPGENHACQSEDGQPLDYRCINIGADVMAKAAREIFGESGLPVAITMHDYFSFCPVGGYFDFRANAVCRRRPMSAWS